MSTPKPRVDKRASLKFRLGKLFCVFGVGYTDADPEKAVLPALIFINLEHPEMDQSEPIARGFALCLGWWNFSITAMLGILTDEKP